MRAALLFLFLGMTLFAFLKRRFRLLVFLDHVLMTVLAVLMIGILKFFGLALVLLWVMTFATFFYGIAFLPDVLPVLVFMVTIRASDLVVHTVLFVG
jgi:hypothetical protein